MNGTRNYYYQCGHYLQMCSRNVACTYISFSVYDLCTQENLEEKTNSEKRLIGANKLTWMINMLIVGKLSNYLRKFSTIPHLFVVVMLIR